MTEIIRSHEVINKAIKELQEEDKFEPPVHYVYIVGGDKEVTNAALILNRYGCYAFIHISCVKKVNTLGFKHKSQDPTYKFHVSHAREVLKRLGIKTRRDSSQTDLFAGTRDKENAREESSTERSEDSQVTQDNGSE